MSRTKIEWATDTWNPVTGCTKVSEGCRHCYAERVASRFCRSGSPAVPSANGAGPDTLSRVRDFGRVLLHHDRLDQPLHWRKPRRVFVCSMSDLFHPDVPEVFIKAVFVTMAAARQHTFIVLTKRPDRMLAVLSQWELDGLTLREGCGVVLPNVIGMVSIEDQATADSRVPLLLQSPFAVRGVSYEPALGPVNFRWKRYHLAPTGEDYREYLERKGSIDHLESLKMINWVICGGESGPKARPMHPDWARSMRDQCQAAGVPFHFKQVGEWGWASQVAGGPITKAICRHGHVADFTREDMIAACRDCTAWEGLRRVGKKAAGRELDGKVWDQVPEGMP